MNNNNIINNKILQIIKKYKQQTKTNNKNIIKKINKKYI